MPAWSPEIANDFIRLAAADGQMLNQKQLHKLVYIAHGWHLAFTGQPLTGDRPEAWSFGPVYRRLADALARYGCEPVDQLILRAELYPDVRVDGDMPAQSELDKIERDQVVSVYQDFGSLSSAQMSWLTRGSDAPWAGVYADGSGEFRDIPHNLIKAQFVQLAEHYQRRLNLG